MPRLILALFMLTPGLAMAYIGPGTGLGAVAAFFALIAGVVLAIVGFLWYPLKRLLKKGDAVQESQADPATIEDSGVREAVQADKKAP
jgi:membrane associated rhomboid family serine protease